MDSLQKAILQTLIYADIFDYCLTSEELYQYLIINKPLTFSAFRKVLSRIIANDGRINTNKSYYFLEGRKATVSLRQKREKWSQEKEKIALRIGGWFKLIPWVKMVGITGALAMANADEDDDIDLIVVTAEKRLWLTRFLAVLFTEILGVRRRPNGKNIKDKICLNMFLDEEHLAVPEKERNLFTSHEVCQVKLVWDKDYIYKKFLWENRWVVGYLGNALMIEKIKNKNEKIQIKNIKSRKSLAEIGNFFEKAAFKFQLAYMKSRRTIEKTETGRVLFHPEDCMGWVMREYSERLKSLGVV